MNRKGTKGLSRLFCWTITRLCLVGMLWKLLTIRDRIIVSLMARWAPLRVVFRTRYIHMGMNSLRLEARTKEEKCWKRMIGNVWFFARCSVLTRGLQVVPRRRVKKFVFSHNGYLGYILQIWNEILHACPLLLSTRQDLTGWQYKTIRASIS